MIEPIVDRTRYLLILLGLILLLGVQARPCAAQASGAYEVIAAVNDFRAANGLSPLQVDPILMSIAQAHSDYQASIQTVTHTGAGGTSPKDRAYAAGFGGGATIFLSENIAGGVNMSIQTAIYQYWQDEAHLYTMLNPAAIYIGAGVGISGDTVYYTVDAGYYAGVTTSGTTNTSGSTESTSTSVNYDPFVVSTPGEDGAIIHVVGYGQSLIGIANTYGVELQTVLDLNNLTMDSIIYTGDQIVIRAADPVTATPTPTETRPVETPRATRTAVPSATRTQKPTESPEPEAWTSTPTAAQVQLGRSLGRQELVIVMVVLALVLLLAVIASGISAGRDQEADR